MGKIYAQEMDLAWPLLLDENLELYKAYGFERATLTKLLGPITTLKYVWLMLSGHGPGKPGKDIRQMGGNVLIDPEGIVRMHHQSVTPHDRPSVQEILAAQQRGDGFQPSL